MHSRRRERGDHLAAAERLRSRARGEATLRRARCSVRLPCRARVLALGASAALLACAAPARAAEIDSLTGRGQPLADSKRALERQLNQRLDEGIARANAAPGVCDEAALYRELRGALASPFIGHVITMRLDADESLDRRRVLRAESIYRDLGLLDNVSVHWKDLSSVVRVGDVLVGVDKLGHFFVEGWSYFETADLEGEGLPAALAWGEGTEATWFGRYTTGVLSHADLVANFEGLRFWRRVLGRADDPLDAGWRANRPYVKCKRRSWLARERQWKRVRGLDLGDYVSPAWDEAINCCSYRTPEIAAMVEARIAELGEADGVDYTCPVDLQGCVEAQRRYGERWAPHLLHEACLAASPDSRPWWRLWD